MKMSERNSCIFYKSFFDAISSLPIKVQVELYNGIFSEIFYGIKPSFSKSAESYYILMKPQLDANYKRYLNSLKRNVQKVVSDNADENRSEKTDSKSIKGTKKSVPKVSFGTDNVISKTEPKPKQNETKTVANENVNDNVNVDDNVDVDVDVNDNENGDENVNENATSARSPLPSKLLNLDNCLNLLLNNSELCSSVCKNYAITSKDFKNYITSFFNDLKRRGETKKCVRDAEKHFLSWLKIITAKGLNKNISDGYERDDRTREIGISEAILQGIERGKQELLNKHL